MSVKQATCYSVTCDECEGLHEASNDFSIWLDQSDAESSAYDHDWLIRGGKHYCEGCRGKHETEGEQ